ncbi:MAG: TetR/AcrR family transcriptional regulator [Acidimicrobiia bacterium]|nr:TetR/AcrR family transcriptional regulator [Acidimicrobiia bacterium]
MSTASTKPIGSRERILAVAAERFLAAGYVETSLRDLASDAGMKAGSLYYHYPSKDHLLIAVLERGMEFMADAFERAAESLDGSTDFEMLRAHVEAHLRALHDNRPYTAGHVTLFRTAPQFVRESIVPLRDHYESLWTALLVRLLPERSSKEITMLRLGLVGAMNASIDWLDTERGDVGPFANLIAEQFWFGASSGGGHGDEARATKEKP